MSELPIGINYHEVLCFLAVGTRAIISAVTCWYSCSNGVQSESVWKPSSVSSANKMYIPDIWGSGNQKDFFEILILPRTYFGRPLGPGPCVGLELVVPASSVVVAGAVVMVIVVVASSVVDVPVVSSATVVVCGMSVDVPGVDVVAGGLQLAVSQIWPVHSR